MKQVLVLVGPTAIGKTDLSLAFAEAFNGEIISGDSVQIYKGLDIGSAKIRKEERKSIPHYLIDELSVTEEYSVYLFQQLARKKIEEIIAKGKLPIIVGGTGLYIKACLYDYVFSEEETDERKVKEYEELSNEELAEKLMQVDPEALETIHTNNRKRLIRALVIAESGTETKTDRIQKQEHELLYDALIIGLTTERTQLYERINQRVLHMMEKGLKEEVNSLFYQYPLLFDFRSMHGIGYKEWKEYFQGNQSEEKTISLIQQHSRNFAKRQYTWFNNQMSVKWYDIDENYQEELFNEIKEWHRGT